MNESNDTSAILPQLMRVIEDRKATRPAHSYTTRLLEGGASQIGAKILEEAVEMVAAAEAVTAAGRADSEKRRHLVHEAADLVYHMLVLLAFCDVPLAEVEAELARRFGTSGLDEKAGRRK
jgi:phosphoribosyl-ATP pyrophosphohydrolase